MFVSRRVVSAGANPCHSSTAERCPGVSSSQRWQAQRNSSTLSAAVVRVVLLIFRKQVSGKTESLVSMQERTLGWASVMQKCGFVKEFRL